MLQDERNRLKGKEFNKRFAEALTKYLVKSVGSERTNQIIKLLKTGALHIVNPETFFKRCPVWNSDIGALAFSRTKNLEDFISEVSSQIKVRTERGESNIDLSSIFFFLSYYKLQYKKKGSSPAIMKDLFRAEGAASFLGASCITMKDNPFIVNFFTPYELVEITNSLGLENVEGYWSTCEKFLEALRSARNRNASMKSPKLNMVYFLYEDAVNNQIHYLNEVFGSLNKKRIKTLLKDVPTLSERSMELISAITKMKAESGVLTANTYGIMEELSSIAKNKSLITISYPTTLIRNVPCYKLISTMKIPHVFVEKKSFLNSFGNQFAEVRIDCSKIREKDLDFYLDAAAQILMLRARECGVNTSMQVQVDELPLKITLFGVKDLSTKFIASIKDKEGNLSSANNKTFKIVISYDADLVKKGGGRHESTHLRIISDIHTDVNADRNYVFNFGDDFVINCGDTSGDAYSTRDWIRTFMRQGISVGGNHLGYSHFDWANDGPQNQYLYHSNIHPNNTINGQKNRLRCTFKGSSTPFLSNDTWEHDGIVYIGTTLYTDFELFGKENKIPCMMEARHRLNDFKRCSYYKHVVKRDNGFVVPLTPEDYLYLFKGGFGYIKNSIKRYRNKKCKLPVVVITHFAPTPYHVADQYKNDPLSASFASDLRKEIAEMPEIRLWCSGHVHNSVDFILGKCRFVSEPFGYYWENGNEFKDKEDIKNYGLRIPIKDVKSTKPWEELLAKEIEYGVVKVYEN